MYEFLETDGAGYTIRLPAQQHPAEQDRITAPYGFPPSRCKLILIGSQDLIFEI